MDLYNQAMAEKSQGNQKQRQYPMKRRNLSSLMNWSLIMDMHDENVTALLRKTYTEIMELSLPQGKHYFPEFLDDSFKHFLSTGDLKYQERHDQKVLGMIKTMNQKMVAMVNPFA